VWPAIALVVPGTAVADPGDLDTSFSENGKQTSNFSDDDASYAYALAIQGDGRAVLGGQTAGPSAGNGLRTPTGARDSRVVPPR
jgi:hypothetical protein